MASSTDRASALSRLAAAYARHQLRRWTGRGSRGGAGRAERIYEPEHYLALTPEERELLPAMSRCLNCGICALVAGRLGDCSRNCRQGRSTGSQLSWNGPWPTRRWRMTSIWTWKPRCPASADRGVVNLLLDIHMMYTVCGSNPRSSSINDPRTTFPTAW